MLSDLRENARIVHMKKHRRDWFQVVSRKKVGAIYAGSRTREGLIQRVCGKLQKHGKTNWREVIRTNQDDDWRRKPRKQQTKTKRQEGVTNRAT